MNIMFRYICLVLVILPQMIFSGGGAPGDTVVIVSSGRSSNSGGGAGGGGGGSNTNTHGSGVNIPGTINTNNPTMLSPHHYSSTGGGGGSGGHHIGGGSGGQPKIYHHIPSSAAGSGHIDHRNSYNLLSEAMSQAVSHEFSSLGSGSADGACHVEDIDCYNSNMQDRLGMEAIRSLHRQLDDDDNGNIDLSESDDFLREELKYDSGYEKRQKAFHFNDDMHISVKELWEAWLRSEVHNWTIEQTTDWLAQSVQLPQYVDLFKQHKVTGAALPRLAVNNMHYVSNVLGIKDPIHKQKIALKAMDVVLFGPPRETGTRWKDYILVTLLLSAIIGCWYAYQQNKNAKKHLRRMAQDMEGLQRAEVALQEMQKELELARMAQENVATEKLDLERRLKEAPSISSSNSDLELLQLKQEIEVLRNELSRAEIELVDHCWSPPAQLKSWLQYTYELENKYHMQKRIGAEKQLQCARDACEKLRRKRSSLVGAFVSTHGKSIDDVDRSIVEARNSLSEVTMELQERVHRWKQIETMLGFQIANNNGIAYLENILYNRNNGGGSSSGSVAGKNSRGRLTNSTDDLDDDSVQGMVDSYSRNSVMSDRTGGSYGNRDDSSVSDDGDNQSVQFYLGSNPASPSIALNHLNSAASLTNLNSATASALAGAANSGGANTQNDRDKLYTATGATSPHIHNSHPVFNSHDSIIEDNRSPSVSSERSVPLPPRNKKPQIPISSASNPIMSTTTTTSTSSSGNMPLPPPPLIPMGRTPLPPPRRLNSHQSQQYIRTASADTFPLEYHYSINSSLQTIPNTATSSGNINSNLTGTPTISTTPLSTEKSGSASVLPTTAALASSSIGYYTIPKSNSITVGITNTTATSTIPNNTINNNKDTINNNNLGSGNQYRISGTGQPQVVMSPSHSDTQVDDTNSTDSSSISDEQKKRRRKLRFPFGKKSSKNKLA